MHYMVFAAQKVGGSDGKKVLNWSMPVGVFVSDSGEDACQAAARKVGWMGSYFAVEGTPWGVELLQTEATEFGAEDAERDLQLSRLERLERRNRELERETGIGRAD